MYCPKCGIQNDETKFCRGCGENLKVISQAMSKRLPVILASKMDAYLERKNERFRRNSNNVRLRRKSMSIEPTGKATRNSKREANLFYEALRIYSIVNYNPSKCAEIVQAIFVLAYRHIVQVG